VHIGVVGGGPSDRDAESADARIRLLAGERSLSIPRRVVRAIRVCLLTLLLGVAAELDLRAQTPAGSQTAPQVTSQAITCHGAQQPRQVAELLFGRDIGHRLGVSESGFARFAAREIMPRFPDGFTVSDATGQWRGGGNGAITREPSKRVEIILPGAADDDQRLDAIVAAYKRRFHQQSVAVILHPACVSF
jgi:Protein of unknown function (DUF3574)